MPVEAVEGEVHLPKRRLAKQLMPVLPDQRAVGRDIDLEPFLMAGVQQFINAGMEQRLAFDMKIDMARMRLNLVKNTMERVELDELRFPFGLRTEAAGQITDACNLDIYFLNVLKSMFSILSRYRLSLSL